ncbi:hypothetical protein AJ88_46275 [Mesorhizobium amorphae CCBAU 01583]|nr:hypothetical protein AJ88_46275 [Mesorhizobium amorphae CCBAU 01583]
MRQDNGVALPLQRQNCLDIVQKDRPFNGGMTRRTRSYRDAPEGKTALIEPPVIVYMIIRPIYSL